MDMTTWFLIGSLFANGLFILMLRTSGTQREWAEQELVHEKEVFEKEKAYFRQDIGELVQMLIRAVETRNQKALDAYVRHLLALTENPELVESLRRVCARQKGGTYFFPTRAHMCYIFAEVAKELRKKRGGWR